MCIICFHFVSTFHIFKEKPAVKTLKTFQVSIKKPWQKISFFHYLRCTALNIYTLSEKTYRSISNAKKGPHTYHVADVCSHREIEHAFEVN